MKARSIVALALGALAALLVGATPGTAAFPGQNGNIAFESTRDAKWEIYVMNADGSGATRLTTNAIREWLPDWSPDGRKIAFHAYSDGSLGIFVMNADGTGLTRATRSNGNDYNAAWSPDGTKIAFASWRDCAGACRTENGEIYVMNPDGTGQTRLTSNSAYDNFPAWSPDGKKITFASGRDGNDEIYVMNADGSGQTRLTNNSAYDSWPAWSPDGRKIAFESSRDGSKEIYVMNPDGSSQTRLTNNSAANDEAPAWSPDSRKIAFTSSTRLTGAIYEMNADGSGQTRLTTIGPVAAYPDYSPDGTKILFNTNRHDSSDIYTMTPAGTDVIRLTADSADNTWPAWAPDGRKIAFVSTRAGNPEIYVMNFDGSAQTRLTNTTSGESKPSWSPDGRKIAFSSNRDGNNEIYVMNADGSGQTRLTSNSASDVTPAWSPNGQKIVFESNRDGNSEIYVINADGSTPTRLTNNNASDQNPSWSPDSAKIAFMSTRDGSPEIFVMNAGGSGQTRLTNLSTFSMLPSWSPDGQKIVFATLRHGNDNYEIYVMNADGSGQTRLTNRGDHDLRPDWQSLPYCYTLTRTHTGNGGDPVATPGNSAGCPVGQYTAGQVVNLTASPFSGHNVGSWTGTSNNASTATTNWVTIPASNHTVGVNYVPATVGGKGFGISVEDINGSSPAGYVAALTWTGGTAQDTYHVIRFDAISGALQFLGPLPATATSYNDTIPADSVLPCYAVAPVRSGNAIGLSDLLCGASSFYSGSAPDNFALRLNQSNTASLSWIVSPGAAGYAIYALRLDGSAPQTTFLTPTTTSFQHNTGGELTCYWLVAFNASYEMTGATSLLCGVPGASTIDATASSLEAAADQARDRVTRLLPGR